MSIAFAGATASCSNESGWTLYLQHSSYTHNNNNFLDTKENIIGCYKDQECGLCDEVYDEVEDLSMVSDASSGPRHFNNHHHEMDEVEPSDQPQDLGYARNKRKTRQNNIKLVEDYYDDDVGLDDTASSPFFLPSNKLQKNSRTLNQVENEGSSSLESLIDFSSVQGFSANHFEARSADFQEPYAYCQPPFSTKQLQQNQWRDY